MCRARSPPGGTGPIYGVPLMLGSVTVASATSSRDNRSSDSDDRKGVVLDASWTGLRSTKTPPATVRVTGPCSHRPSQRKHQGRRGERHVHPHPHGSKWSEHLLLHREQSFPGGRTATEGTINYGPNEFPKADPYSLAIKGGTGKYRTAHGEIRIQELTPDEWRFTLRIIL
jgi:hypothetical protein